MTLKPNFEKLDNPQTTFTNTKISPSSFIGRKRHVVQQKTLQYQLNALKETGRYDAFKLKWKPIYDDPIVNWPVPKHLFWDSDVAKWIEGACYFLHEHHDEQIDSAVKELTQMIQEASQPDGYLNIHFTLVDPKGRFTNLRDMHELYNAGHLIEAALAHWFRYQNNDLLDPILKYVDLMCDTFGTGDGHIHGYPGHPEIELALLRLHRVTKNERHFRLAQCFVTERGNSKGQDGKHYYTWEAEQRGEKTSERPLYYPALHSYWYQQAHKPIVEQASVEGHSVRAMYLLTAAADLAVRSPEDAEDYTKALKRLWSNMVEKKMYLTGGIGAMDMWEGFGPDYFLPQGTDEGGCYAETCASIGVMMLAERMLQIDFNGHYGDIMELSFYNAVLGGMSCDGTKFTYTNQLASSDESPSKRAEWFQCACCPPNVTRLLGSIAGYMWDYTETGDTSSVDVRIHMYSSADLNIPLANSGAIQIKLKADEYPWDGKIKVFLRQSKSHEVNLALRIPAWAEDWTISPELPKPKLTNGYLHIPHDWLVQHSQFEINLPMKPRLIAPHPYTNQQIAAYARGPIVYCLEDNDNDWVEDHFKSLILDRTIAPTEETKTDPDTGETYVALIVKDGGTLLDLDAYNAQPGIAGDQKPLVKADKRTLHFSPFYFRANRGGKGQMRVGLRVQ